MLRIGIVGTGRRACAFADSLINSKQIAQYAKLEAICDSNPKRLAAFHSLYSPAALTFTDYDAFLKNAGLDAVIVTTPCNTHAELTVKAFEAGKHVLCEKAMALTPEELKAMLDAERKSGKGLQLGLCLRYTDFMTELIPIIRRGEIGDVIMVSVLDTLEGSDHFNRWHRSKAISGGIMMQKGTHTLDLINWIMDAVPKSVTALGGRDVYKARKECSDRRCFNCPERLECREFLDIYKDESHKLLYKDAEDQDGYIWDRCVFDPAIDICDNVLTQLDYGNGKKAQYAISLFFAANGIEREFVIIGTKGRIDVSRRREEIIIRRRKSKDIIKYNLEGHGEGFEKEMFDFIEMINSGRKPIADADAGYWSAIAGLAAEKSIEEKRTININELIK